MCYSSNTRDTSECGVELIAQTLCAEDLVVSSGDRADRRRLNRRGEYMSTAANTCYTGKYAGKISIWGGFGHLSLIRWPGSSASRRHSRTVE
ncbi:hypothetical protein GCM10022414_18870 [Zhongshania borealis]|uniref:Uncharacterized protein n=1 Tax=Zhongshania borealis TaxID=889488 RepID=A0ABP7WRC0_9GAMM